MVEVTAPAPVATVGLVVVTVTYEPGKKTTIVPALVPEGSAVVAVMGRVPVATAGLMVVTVT